MFLFVACSPSRSAFHGQKVACHFVSLCMGWVPNGPPVHCTVNHPHPMTSQFMSATIGASLRQLIPLCSAPSPPILAAAGSGVPVLWAADSRHNTLAVRLGSPCVCAAAVGRPWQQQRRRWQQQAASSSGRGCRELEGKVVACCNWLHFWACLFKPCAPCLHFLPCSSCAVTTADPTAEIIAEEGKALVQKISTAARAGGRKAWPQLATARQPLMQLLGHEALDPGSCRREAS